MGCALTELRALVAIGDRDGIEARAKVPEECGPEILPSPARGRVLPFQEGVVSVAELERGGWTVGIDYAAGHKPARCEDAFDLMAAKSKGDPFTPGQISIGRHYAMIVERHEAAGVKCSSLESTGGGSGNGGDFMDALLQEREEIDRLRRRIGDGVSMAVRRVRPSSRGTRRSITDRALVDAVCIAGQTVSEVLRSHGWVVKGQTVKAARVALGEALDRMVGPVKAARCGAVVVDDRSAEVWQASAAAWGKGGK